MNNFSTKKWISLSIELSKKDDINFLYLNFCNDIIGTTGYVELHEGEEEE